MELEGGGFEESPKTQADVPLDRNMKYNRTL